MGTLLDSGHDSAAIAYLNTWRVPNPPPPPTPDQLTLLLLRRYFAQISDLRGVAINGWNNKNAKKLFSNVDDTFRSWEKMKNTKDFEIDWILFNGSTVTVIEVIKKSKTSIKDNGNSFKRKLEQIKKDRTIIQHLLEVCDCQSTRVNYVIACTNVSITKVTDGIFLKNHTRFFEKKT